MSWRRVTKSLQAFSAHTLLFCFTLLLVLKLDHLVPCSWWIIFFPLFLFHAVVARGRFSLPAPSAPHGHHWAPFHAIVATPLLIAFELLLCVFLESAYVKKVPAVSLKIVFLPLLAFEITILIDNFRMCKALLPGDDVSLNDEAIWETLPHFWVAISMVFFFAATVFTLLKLCGEVASLGWWDLFINFGIAECFAFLVCTKWSNPMIHRNFIIPEASSSSAAIRYLDWNNGLVVSTDDISEDGMCGLHDIGGHVMKIPIIGFQVLLCMRLEGKPAAARFIPLPVVFSPVFLVQALGVLIAASNLVERIVILLRTGAGTGRYFIYAARARDSFGFLHHGSRLLGWWSTDEGSREEQAQLYLHGSSGQVLQSSWVSHYVTHFHMLGWVGSSKKQPLYPLDRGQVCVHVTLPRPHPQLGYTGFVWFGFGLLGKFIFLILVVVTSVLFCLIILHMDLRYNTFSGYPPETVKKMPKKDLTEEVWRLQAALNEQTDITKSSQQNYERLQNEKVLCRICFEREMNTVLLPCRHHILCSSCCEKCQKCPICRVSIQERLRVYDV